MMSPTRTATLAVGLLSLGLSIAVLACAARSLSVFHSQHALNVWLLPLWPSHFDLRGLQAAIGIAAATVVLNIIVLLPTTTLVPKLSHLALLPLVTSLLSTSLVLAGLAFQAVLNSPSRARDTLQTWSCHWEAAWFGNGQSRPQHFESLCLETRFSYYGSIPLLLLQLMLVGVSVYALTTSTTKGSPDRKSFVDLEKKGHELGTWQSSGSDNDDGAKAATVNVQEAKR